MKIKIGNYILSLEKHNTQISQIFETEKKSISNDKNTVFMIVVLFVFASGFLIGKATYDKSPISREEYNEINKLEYYE